MKKLKIVTFVGTRPEIIKLSRIIPSLDQHFDHILVHTGQNYDYELNQIFFNDLGIRKPDFFLESAKPTAAKTIASIIEKSDDFLREHRPNAVLFYGDTNSCLAALSAKRVQIPIFHLEAGNRCFDQRVPEEINRKIIDHLSDINFVHSEHARRYLIAEGIKPETIFKTGSPMVEIFNHYRERIDSSDVLTRLELKSNNYFLVSGHREENVDYDNNFKDFLNSLNAIALHFNKRVIVSTHPRTKKRLDEMTSFEMSDKVEFIKPLGYFDYNKLQQEAFCVISDSGTLTEESSILNFPGVMIRKTHERPEGMDVGAVIMSGLNPQNVILSINLAVEVKKDKPLEIEDYRDNKVSLQVVKNIASYIDYVNRIVWKKDL